MSTLSDKLENDDRINNIYNPKMPVEPPKATNSFSDGTNLESVGSGQSTEKLTMVDGYWQSANFVAGTSGWRISPTGDVEFGNGKFRGDITGASGTFTGNVTTDVVTDSTYGYNGVFVKQIKTTSMANENILIGPDNGGLLSVTANYKSISTGYFWWLTPVAHFYVFKSGGNYYIYHAGVQIDIDTNADTIYYTCLFNSLESGTGY